MSVYFDFEIKPSPHQQISNHEQSAWHDTFALLAVSSKSEYIQPTGLVSAGVVNVFLDEGELIEDANMQRPCMASLMKWHPTLKVIAVGWESGELCLFNEPEHAFFDNTAVHKSTITVIEWSSGGGRLVTGDQNGILAIWNVSQHGHLINTPIKVVERDSPITHCLLYSPDFTPDTNSDFDLNTFKNTPSKSSARERIEFFLCTRDGSVVYGEERGEDCVLLVKEQDSLLRMFLSENASELITITHGLFLSVHEIGEGPSVSESNSVKLSGRSDMAKFEWIGMGLLAMTTADYGVRVWDLIQNSNYMLELSSFNLVQDDVATCVAYNPIKSLLAAGTNNQKIVLWKYVYAGSEPQDAWEPLTTIQLGGCIAEVGFCKKRDILSANNSTTVYILKQHVMSTHYNQEMAVVQVSAHELSISSPATDSNLKMRSDIQIKGAFVTREHVVVWDGDKVLVFEIIHGKSHIRPAGSFSSKSRNIMLFDQSAFILLPEVIQITTLQGTVKQNLKLSEGEGEYIAMFVENGFLLAATGKNIIRIWNVTRREAKLLHNKKISDLFPTIEQIQSIKCNTTGNKVSITMQTKEGYPDSKMLIWNLENDTLAYIDFSNGVTHTPTGESELERSDGQKDTVFKDQLEHISKLRELAPISHFWDSKDPRMLVCESHTLSNLAKKGKLKGRRAGNFNKTHTKMLISMFVTSDSNIVIHDLSLMQPNDLGLIGCDVPNYILTQKNGGVRENAETVTSRNDITRRPLRDFVGMEENDRESIKAMSDYSFYSTVGDMDEAFRSIKLIKSQAVWENMARMCVKSRRLDVAAVCLGNMRHVRGARALREARNEPEKEARVAMLAIQLNMYSEAEELYTNCGRYDLLNKLYQATGQWEKAIQVGESQDRMHLKRTHFKNAQFLESIGDINGAISEYERSDTHHNEVPRMLFDDQDRLADYILNSKDRTLRKWWAEYLESLGEMDSAIQFYEAAQDHMSLVRMYCYFGQFEKARSYAEKCGDKAACYHMASQLFEPKDAQLAMHFYTKAKSYRNAISIAKDAGLEAELMTLALLARPTDMLGVARYFESRGHHEKAAILYHKAGNLGHAIELCFRTQQFEALRQMVEDLDQNTNPTLVKRCADFFIEFGQCDKAVDLMLLGGKYLEALDLCIKQNVYITEELAERMTLSKPEQEDPSASLNRNKILESVADSCMRQQSYRLAAKKYTQAGLKTKAMKALLKSGDVEKIIFFTNVSRQKDIYVMAANYLQSLDWKRDSNIMKHIILFYTKGKSFDSLAMFYEHCAQLEIDDYQNYEKAVGALTEALKYISRAKNMSTQEQEGRLALYQERISLIEKYLEARALFQTDQEAAVTSCKHLLENPKVDVAVKIGDVYGLLVEYYVTVGDHQQAYTLIEELKSRDSSVNLSHYISKKVMESIHTTLGLSVQELGQPELSQQQSHIEDEDILEDLVQSP